ncbi:MAG: hypothetical protein KDB35_16305 [Acidimicrobiales bacterium]|nr:hypothetical protein [Acidimicrobiales bacterium]
MRSDPTLAFAAGVGVVAIVLLRRHGRTWWHRHTGDHHPARLGRLVMAGLALLGLTALTLGMALGAGPDSTAEPQPDLDGLGPSGGIASGGPTSVPPDRAPVTTSAGS